MSNLTIIIIFGTVSTVILFSLQVSGAEYPTTSKLSLKNSVEQLRNLTPNENTRTADNFISNFGTVSTVKNAEAENKDEDLREPGFQDFVERLSDVGYGYIVRDLYTAAITEDDEIETVLGDLGRIGVGAYIIQKLGENKKSRTLIRLSRYIGVAITIVGSYFDMYLLFDSIGCLIRRRRLEAVTGMQLKFNSSTVDKSNYENFKEMEAMQPNSVFCKREHPIIEIIAAVIATIADSIAFVIPKYGDAAALVEALYQVMAFYYVEAVERREDQEESMDTFHWKVKQKMRKSWRL